MKTTASTHVRKGFALLEVMLALLIFGWVGTRLASAIYSIGRISNDVRKELVISRVLDSELRRAMSVPQLEERDENYSLEENGIDIHVLVEPLEEMENEEGRLLQQMYRIVVTAYWWEGLEEFSRPVETWRYARLYQKLERTSPDLRRVIFSSRSCWR